MAAQLAQDGRQHLWLDTQDDNVCALGGFKIALFHADAKTGSHILSSPGHRIASGHMGELHGVLVDQATDHGLAHRS